MWFISISGISSTSKIVIRIVNSTNVQKYYTSMDNIAIGGEYNTGSIKIPTSWSNGIYTAQAGWATDIIQVSFEIKEGRLVSSVSSGDITTTPTVAPTPTLIPTSAPTLAPTATPILVVTVTPTDATSSTPTSVPNPTIEPIATATPTATATVAPTATVTPTPTTYSVSTQGNNSNNSSSGIFVPNTVTTSVTVTPVQLTNVAFNDLESVSWAQESVTALASKGIINGMGEGNFKPNDYITRGQFIKIIIYAFNAVDSTATSTFKDVNSTEWYYSSVATAQKLGISNGYEDGTFGVNKTITREEMAVIAYRTSKVMNKSLSKNKTFAEFKDSNSIASYATEGIKNMVEAGIINGLGDNMFGPTQNATRAQVAKIMYSILKNLGDI